MIGRFVALASILVGSACYWYLCRKFGQFAELYCGFNEARGNCEAFQALAVNNTTPIFAVAMVVLAIVTLLPRRSGN